MALINKERKIQAERNRVINCIALGIRDNINIDIEGRDIEVVYDEILPDLCIRIPMNKDVIKRYDIGKTNIDDVLFDIYTEYIKEVCIKFPNGEIDTYEVSYVDKSMDNELYCCTWQVPLITIYLHGLSIEVSILDLIDMGATVTIKKYVIE